jgi:hypothetical protein
LRPLRLECLADLLRPWHQWRLLCLEYLAGRLSLLHLLRLLRLLRPLSLLRL